MLLLNNDKYSIHKINDLVFMINNNDSIIGNSIKNGRNWEQDLQKLLLDFTTERELFVDLGANIGTHTINFSRYFKSVIAFEPHPEHVKYLYANLALNNVENATVVPMGVSDTFKTISIPKHLSDFKLDAENNFGNVSLLPQFHKSNVETVDIKVTPLDLFEFPCRISLLKIDVETMEHQVLRGATTTILKHKPVLCVESWDDKADETRRIIEEELHYETIYRKGMDFICLPSSENQ